LCAKWPLVYLAFAPAFSAGISLPLQKATLCVAFTSRYAISEVLNPPPTTYFLAAADSTSIRIAVMLKGAVSSAAPRLDRLLYGVVLFEVVAEIVHIYSIKVALVIVLYSQLAAVRRNAVVSVCIRY
jgi:hypothetical protein